MSTLTISAATATFRRYQTATPEQDYAFAQAIRFLNAADPKRYSLNGLLTVAEDLSRKVSRTRLGVILRTVKALPEDFTIDAYQSALKEQTDKNRAASAATESAPAADSAPEGVGPTLADGPVPVAALSVTDAIRLLWELTEAHGHSDAFCTAIDQVAEFLAPVVLVATPVAA